MLVTIIACSGVQFPSKALQPPDGHYRPGLVAVTGTGTATATAAVVSTSSFLTKQGDLLLVTVGSPSPILLSGGTVVSDPTGDQFRFLTGANNTQGNLSAGIWEAASTGAGAIDVTVMVGVEMSLAVTATSFAGALPDIAVGEGGHGGSNTLPAGWFQFNNTTSVTAEEASPTNSAWAGGVNFSEAGWTPVCIDARTTAGGVTSVFDNHAPVSTEKFAVETASLEGIVAVDEAYAPNGLVAASLGLGYGTTYGDACTLAYSTATYGVAIELAIADQNSAYVIGLASGGSNSSTSVQTQETQDLSTVKGAIILAAVLRNSSAGQASVWDGQGDSFNVLTSHSFDGMNVTVWWAVATQNGTAPLWAGNTLVAEIEVAAECIDGVSSQLTVGAWTDNTGDGGGNATIQSIAGDTLFGFAATTANSAQHNMSAGWGYSTYRGGSPFSSVRADYGLSLASNGTNTYAIQYGGSWESTQVAVSAPPIGVSPARLESAVRTTPTLTNLAWVSSGPPVAEFTISRAIESAGVCGPFIPVFLAYPTIRLEDIGSGAGTIATVLQSSNVSFAAGGLNAASSVLLGSLVGRFGRFLCNLERRHGGPRHTHSRRESYLPNTARPIRGRSYGGHFSRDPSRSRSPRPQSEALDSVLTRWSAP